MLEKIKEKHRITKAKKKKIWLKKQAEEEKAEYDRLEKEKNALEAEKLRLCNLNDKELLVELIFAVRGFYKQLIETEDSLQDIADKIDEIEERISHLESNDSECESNSED